MSFSTLIRTFQTINICKGSLIRQQLRHRRKGQPRFDPDLDLQLLDDNEEEPVAYLAELPVTKPTKLTPSLERQLQKETLKMQIQRRKQLKEMTHKEPLLLTWAAKARIKYLHSTEPDVWDIKTLARSFPVSEYAIQEIIRSKKIPYDRAELEKMDRKAMNNWLKLKEAAKAYLEGEEIDPMYRRMLEDDERRSRIINAAGIVDLPVPSKYQRVQTQVDLAEKARPVVKRRFSSILDNWQPNVGSSAVSGEKPVYIGVDNSDANILLQDISGLKVNRQNDPINYSGSNDNDENESRNQYSGDVKYNKGFEDRKLTESIRKLIKSDRKLTESDRKLTASDRTLTKSDSKLTKSLSDVIKRSVHKPRQGGAIYSGTSKPTSVDVNSEKRYRSIQDRDNRSASDNIRHDESDDRNSNEFSLNRTYSTCTRQRDTESYRNDRYSQNEDKYTTRTFGKQRDVNRKYNYSESVEFGDESGLSGSLDDIYLFDKPNKSGGKKKRTKKLH